MSVYFHRGSCISKTHELRITRRCLVEDLELPADTAFVNAQSVDIVHAFASQRADEAVGTRTIGPEAGDRTLYRLGHGNDHRGATWHDPQENVVWLCAYRLHRSGEAADAFPYFRDLMQRSQMMPTADDYERLFTDRSRRFVETVRQDAEELLQHARADPGRERRGRLGGEEYAGVVVEVVDTLEETYVAFSVVGMDHRRVLIVLTAFFPNATFGDWELANALPTRSLSREDSEVCYRILRSSGDA